MTSFLFALVNHRLHCL